MEPKNHKVRIQLPNGKWFDYFKNLTETEANEVAQEVKEEFLRVMNVEVTEQ